MNALLTKLVDWVESRTGIRRVLHEALYENIPGGARWRYVWGSTLVFTFVTQVITGMFLWMAYSPSAQTAWESVYFIQFVMQGGWLLRGIHHFTAQAMVVLLPLHLIQVVWDKAYKAPREVNFWLGITLMQIVLGLALTGYLLPWDQKGYWATRVATNLMSLPPGVGKTMQKVVVGGDDYGHHTLTRFFALHAGVLPTLFVLTLVLHIALFRRHGLTPKLPLKRPDQYFWPHQVLKDAVACLIVLSVILLCTIRWNVYGLVTGQLNPQHLGAELGAPADGSEPYSAARPEWYFLFLFQLLKYFKSEFVGAIVVPSAIMYYLYAMPMLGRWKWGHWFNVTAVLVLVLGAGVLTLKALEQDNYHRWYAYNEKKFATDDDPGWKEYDGPYEASQSYQRAVTTAERESERVQEIVKQGIGVEGALALTREDPMIQGPRIFARRCAGCHSYDQEGVPDRGGSRAKHSAPNLYGFATRAWIQGVLDPDRIGTSQYFRNTKHAKGKMVEFVSENLKALEGEKKEALENVVAFLSAQAELPSQRDADAEAKKSGQIEKGAAQFKKAIKGDYSCADCHGLNGEGGTDGPDLKGYGSAEWLRAFISDPVHKRFYGGENNDRMPSFAKGDDPASHHLSKSELDLLVRWLRGEDPLAEAKP